MPARSRSLDTEDEKEQKKKDLLPSLCIYLPPEKKSIPVCITLPFIPLPQLFR